MTYMLARDDVRTDLHPRIWEDICDSLGVGPQEEADVDAYPEMIIIRAVRTRTTHE